MPDHLHRILQLLLKNDDLTADIPAGYESLVKGLRY